MRKPYAVPEEYENWGIEELKQYSGHIAYMVMIMCSKRCVETPFDRHVLNNAYDEFNALKIVIESHISSYTTKALMERILEILEKEFAAYDQRGRDIRLTRKLLKAKQRLQENAV